MSANIQTNFNPPSFSNVFISFTALQSKSIYIVINHTEVFLFIRPMAHHAPVPPSAKGMDLQDISMTRDRIQRFYLGPIPAEIHQPGRNGTKKQ